ncbi:plastocyanin/azurin family copper-binding protein [Paraburkholderia sp. BL10I2N1]|uniref:plastocyanin/azurin family copper-binding protein n=1 Tax=Paraburkholderia sp. BL10I2N1 TaxID=1938796 RepID=UPI00105E395B|nr:plastocyanin/azurin family copper-binding protein [Paraburkholderia sp. BL10I2N1]TDN58888.1 putative cupredoxin-like copper-binding protein [Paraburkholderia sp. BL10I2N1]
MISRRHAVFLLGAVALSLASMRGNAGETVQVELTSTAIHLATSEVKAGTVTFEVTGSPDGNTTHELVVLKTELPDGHLPVQKDTVAESGFKKMGEVEDVAPGTSKRLMLKLAPGRYVLICNRPGHYAMGMHASLIVAR